MSEKKDEDKKYDHLDPEQAEKAKKAAIKLEAVKAMRQLQNDDSEWTLVQEILQDVQAAHIVANSTSDIPVTQLVKDLKKEIQSRYKDEEELRTLLLEAVPSVRSVRQWLKKENWDEAVWQRIRADKLFSPSKRAEVVQALHQRAKDRSDAAAKIYLTLSGDYVEKQEISDKTIETFRDINKILHNKNKKLDE